MNASRQITSIVTTLEQRYDDWLKAMDEWCEIGGSNSAMPALDVDDLLFALRGLGAAGVLAAERYEWMQVLSRGE